MTMLYHSVYAAIQKGELNHNVLGIGNMKHIATSTKILNLGFYIGTKTAAKITPLNKVPDGFFAVLTT